MDLRVAHPHVVRGVQGERAVQPRGVEVDLRLLEQANVDHEFEVGMEAERQDRAADAASQGLGLVRAGERDVRAVDELLDVGSPAFGEGAFDVPFCTSHAVMPYVCCREADDGSR
ncbi:MAG TPA: hypothetical protein VGQ92_29965 [Actinoplanes sp.]|jgi:hypothetical protein|nr:hypothetical protein [Actinoplanes sp.]